MQNRLHTDVYDTMKGDQIVPFVFVLFAMGFICMVMLNGTIKSKTSFEKFPSHFILRRFSSDHDASRSARFGSGKSKNNECDAPQAFQPLLLNQTRTFKYPYKEMTENLTKQSVSAYSGELLALIRNYWIVNPNSKIYRFRKEEVDYSGGVSPIIDNILGYMEGGFYVDIGAFDGETSSNTLFFEKYRRWNGILVEGEKYQYGRLRSKNRQSLILNSCISPLNNLMMGDFTRSLTGRLTRIKNQTVSTSKLKQITRVQCLPLLSVFLAVGIDKVDYLSLVQEGDELGILKTIPFDKLNMKVVTVAVNPKTADESSITNFLRQNKFVYFIKLQFPYSRFNTLIFKRI